MIRQFLAFIGYVVIGSAVGVVIASSIITVLDAR